MHGVSNQFVLFPTIATAVLFGCYESTTIEVSPSDTPAAETDTFPDTDTARFPDTDTKEIRRDTESDTEPPVQGPMFFRIRNGRSFIAYFDLTFRKWMDLKREDPESETEIYLDWPYCVERCVDLPDNNDPLCHRPCIAISQVYALHPGDEVDVAWDGKVRLLDPDRLPYCYCSIETEPVPGRYTVTLSIYHELSCPEPCRPTEQSGILEAVAVGPWGPTVIAEYPFSIPWSDPVLVLEF